MIRSMAFRYFRYSVDNSWTELFDHVDHQVLKPLINKRSTLRMPAQRSEGF